MASVRRERSLDHAASRAIIPAYAVLRRWVGANDDRWLPARARELLPHLIAVTGLRPQVPSRAELERVRYTPITAGFAPVAELSRQIANRRGLAADSAPAGECQGVLLDVAELWELYVLAVLRRAAAGLGVRHGTREVAAAGSLLRSEVDGAVLGALRPDALVIEGGRTSASSTRSTSNYTRPPRRRTVPSARTCTSSLRTLPASVTSAGAPGAC